MSAHLFSSESEMAKAVLLVEDEANIRKILKAILTSAGFKVFAAENLAQAKHCLVTEPIHIVLTDLRLKGEDGSELLGWVKEHAALIPVIILTAHGTVDSAVGAMKKGAFDYISKPFDKDELLALMHKAEMHYRYHREHSVRAESRDREGLPIIGEHARMQEVFELIRRVSKTDSSVLITGESGTGKELVAQAIHDLSERRKLPFIKINCAAIPSTLMESELFGYERGAFTGAVNAKPGRFELADGGTLFLDEIGEMSSEMQAKLLRVLQETSFERVGGIRTINVNVRLITATNKDLKKEVESGKFREDLFYRLNVVPIELPALRDRPSDIPLLVANFLEKFSQRMGKPTPRVSAECLSVMSQYAWPGNIRQLENVLERFMVINDADTVTVDNLPSELKEDSQMAIRSLSLKQKVRDVTRAVEKQAIEDALIAHEQNVTRTAKALNISRKGLQLKMKELGLRL